MPAPLSIDIRQKMVDIYESGEETIRSLAERFKVGASTVMRIINKHNREGSIKPLPHGGGRPRKIPDSNLNDVINMIEKKNDSTLKELCDEYFNMHHVEISISGMSRTLSRMEITRKKNFFS